MGEVVKLLKTCINREEIYNLNDRDNKPSIHLTLFFNIIAYLLDSEEIETKVKIIFLYKNNT